MCCAGGAARGTAGIFRQEAGWGQFRAVDGDAAGQSSRSSLNRSQHGNRTRAMAPQSEDVLKTLAGRGRVLLLGGMAVVAHGLARFTRDVDVWLEPFDTAQQWAGRVRDVLQAHGKLAIQRFGSWAEISPDGLAGVIEEDRAVRLAGADRPIDVFREPNELSKDDFDAVWQRACLTLGIIRVPDEIDLLVTKQNTGRSQDVADISYLEDRVRRRLCGELAQCDAIRATELLDRYVDAWVAAAALDNPHPAVRAAGHRLLEELASQGDPFAREMLDQSGK
jgi:hypothetical protein